MQVPVCKETDNEEEEREVAVLTRRRRGWALWVITVCIALVLAACGDSDDASDSTTADDGASTTAGEPREFTVYNSLSTEEMAPLLEAFETYYENEHSTELTITEFSQPAEELVATLTLESDGDAITADTVVASHTQMVALQQSLGLFAPVTTDGLDDPAIQEGLNEPLADGTAVPIALQPYVIQYHTENVSPEDIPTSWADLLGDEWNNQVVMGDPAQTNGAHGMVWFLTEHMSDPPFGWEYYENLAELNPLILGGHGGINEYIASGERSAAITALSLVVLGARDGIPTAAVFPEEGVPSFTTSAAVVEDSSGADIAEEFIDWLLTADGQEAALLGIANMPIRTDVSYDPPFEVDLSNGVFHVDGQWVFDNRENSIDNFNAAMR